LSQQYESDETTVDLEDFALAEGGDSGETTRYDPVRPYPLPTGVPGLEANIILIAHPDEHMLGRRYRLPPHGTLEIGRSSNADISMPHVHSLSRNHARLSHLGAVVEIEDLGSTNGTYVNDRPIAGGQPLKSGDRFQLGAAHFKFLHEEDPEHAYHQAIYHLVMCDGLTQIYNQRKFDEELRREVSRAQRHQRPLSLMHFDIDHFKNINDTYGHLCGDAVLQQIARLVQDHLRPEQVFARVGGEEFVILSPEMELDGIERLAEKLRQRIEDEVFRYAELEVHVTCSFGVAVLAPEMSRPDDLYAAADRAMYQSKQKGRNQVSRHAA